MTNNVLLFKAANDAIFALYSDMSVDKATTIDRLEELREELDILLSELRDDTED